MPIIPKTEAVEWRGITSAHSAAVAVDHACVSMATRQVTAMAVVAFGAQPTSATQRRQDADHRAEDPQARPGGRNAAAQQPVRQRPAAQVPEISKQERIHP
jgi:hypothetical protein